MSVSVTLQFPSLEDAILSLAKLRGSDAKVEVAPKAPVDPGKPAKTEKPAATPPSAAKTDAPATPPAASSAPAPASDDVYKTKISPVIAAGANKDKPATVAVLGQFGAKTGKDLKPEQYDEFLAALAKALEPTADLT